MRGEQGDVVVEIIDYYRRTRRLEELDGMAVTTVRFAVPQALRLSAA